MTDLMDWRDAFLDNLSLDPSHARWLAGHLQDTYYAETLQIAAAAIPLRFAGALPSEPHVLAWMGTLVKRACAERGLHPAWSQGPSLLLMGLTGRGKTHEALGAARGLAACGIRPGLRYTTQADFYAELRPRPGIDPEAVHAEAARAGLLVMDDIGVAKESAWTEQALWRVVDYRYREIRPTVFISNCPPGNGKGELNTILGDRVASRLAETAEPVVFEGRDWRRGAA